MVLSKKIQMILVGLRLQLVIMRLLSRPTSTEPGHSSESLARGSAARRAAMFLRCVPASAMPRVPGGEATRLSLVGTGSCAGKCREPLLNHVLNMY